MKLKKKRLIAPQTTHDAAIMQCNAIQYNAMQCHAMSCHTPHPIPAHSRTGRKVGIETRKKREKEQRSSPLLCFGHERRTPAFVNPIPIPSIKTPATQTDRHLISEGKRVNRKKPRLRKVCAGFQESVPVIPLARRENNQHK
jgi:hypothetical protein